MALLWNYIPWLGFYQTNSSRTEFLFRHIYGTWIKNNEGRKEWYKQVYDYDAPSGERETDTKWLVPKNFHV